MSDIFHPLAWLAWLAAAAVSALVTHNPLYLLLLLLTTGVTYGVVGRGVPQAQAWSTFLSLGLVLVAFSVPINALLVHVGRVTLFSLPAGWPVIGGRITLEATLYGVANGLSLLSLLLVFATFNIGMDPSRLLRMTPRFFYTIGVVTAIAVTFVPQMLAAFNDIRDVQRLRGHRPRGLRDLGPLLLPLLTTGLERAIQLAESMDARGFSQDGGASARPGHLIRLRLGLALALSLLLLGLFAASYWPGARPWAPVFVVPGLALLAALFWMQGRTIERTRYRRWLWRRRDTLLSLLCASVLLIVLVVWVFARVDLIYYPYPPYSLWPTFNPWLGLALALLIVPALLVPVRRPGRPPLEATR